MFQVGWTFGGLNRGKGGAVTVALADGFLHSGRREKDLAIPSLKVYPAFRHTQL